MKIVLGVALFMSGLALASAAEAARRLGDGEPRLSVQSVLARGALRLLFRLPWLKGGKMFGLIGWLLDKESAWKVPGGYSMTTVELENCRAELLSRDGSGQGKAVLLLHGGAYIFKLNNIYRNMAVRYSVMASGAEVLCLDYRLAPEHAFPAALDDALNAWDWLLARGYRPKDILVAGDSAGGNLTLALALKLRDSGKEMPGALVCMSPWTDMAGSGKSYKEKASVDPIFGNNPEYIPPENGIMPKVKPFILSYTGDADPRCPYLSPAFASYHNFPPMLIQVGTHEILESDSEQVYHKAIEAGVDATLTRYYGLFHVFQVFGNMLPESAKAWDEVGLFIADKLKPSLKK